MQRNVNILKMSPKRTMMRVLFLTLFCLAVHLFIMQYVYDFSGDLITIMTLARLSYPKDAKYVLAWNQHSLINKRNIASYYSSNCSMKKCVFTENRNLLYEYIRFDAIIFTEVFLDSDDRPIRRSKSQLYIFSSKESSHKTPACEKYNDKFFNLTFTYRLDSDIVWSFFIVRNLSGTIVAPKKVVNWTESSDPVSNEIKSILKLKKKAALWLIDDCYVTALKNDFLRELQEELYYLSLNMDIYGKCTNHKCPHDDCGNIIRNDYYFVAFEEPPGKGYVSDTILQGYNNYAVPIIYGTANYTRLLPPGSYINARDIQPYKLAQEMKKALNQPDLYETYFRWRNLYTVESNIGSHHNLCNLCKKIHIKGRRRKNWFRTWWNSYNGMKACKAKTTVQTNYTEENSSTKLTDEIVNNNNF